MIGANMHRIEDEPLLRGNGRYIDDLAIPNVLHVAFVRSTYPHALIRHHR